MNLTDFFNFGIVERSHQRIVNVVKRYFFRREKDGFTFYRIENGHGPVSDTLKTAKIISIIGLVLSVIIVGIMIFLFATGQYDEIQDKYMKMLEEMQQQQQQQSQ